MLQSLASFHFEKVEITCSRRSSFDSAFQNSKRSTNARRKLHSAPHLERLPQPHFVTQHAAPLALVVLRQPAHAHQLVVPQRAPRLELQLPRLLPVVRMGLRLPAQALEPARKKAGTLLPTVCIPHWASVSTLRSNRTNLSPGHNCRSLRVTDCKSYVRNQSCL